jgi:formyl-CoA transferase
VQTFAEAARAPAVLARDMLQRPDAAAVPITGPAAKLSRTPLRVRSAAPALGAHNQEILDELGVSEEEQRRLREERVL